METNGVKIMRRRKSSGRNRGKKRRIKEKLTEWCQLDILTSR